MKECKVCSQQVENDNVCDRCDEFTTKTNRSFGQTKMLLQLVNNNWEKLELLEANIKKNHVFYCPENESEVTNLLNL